MLHSLSTCLGCSDCAACRYVEVHMEQGPVLESRGYAIGPVAAIAGQTRLAVSVEGTQVCPKQ